MHEVAANPSLRSQDLFFANEESSFKNAPENSRVDIAPVAMCEACCIHDDAIVTLVLS
jgi:hypothetical protein